MCNQKLENKIAYVYIIYMFIVCTCSYICSCTINLGFFIWFIDDPKGIVLWMHKVIVFPWDDLLRLARGLKAIDRGAGAALAMGNSVSRPSPISKWYFT